RSVTVSCASTGHKLPSYPLVLADPAFVTGIFCFPQVRSCGTFSYRVDPLVRYRCAAPQGGSAPDPAEPRKNRRDARKPELAPEPPDHSLVTVVPGPRRAALRNRHPGRPAGTAPALPAGRLHLPPRRPA